MSQFNWDDTPNLWPNLQELSLVNSGHDAPGILNQIVPQLQRLNNLKKFVVPEQIEFLSGDDEIRSMKTKNLIAQFGSETTAGIQIDYPYYKPYTKPYVCCTYLQDGHPAAVIEDDDTVDLHRHPTYALCKNHQKISKLKGRKRYCPWRECSCELCHETNKKRNTNAQQVASRRAEALALVTAAPNPQALKPWVKK